MVLYRTERLIARRLTLHDVDAMMAIYGDRETVRFVGDAEPLSEESCRDWVRITDKNFDQRGYGMFGLVDQETGELIGCAGIVHPGQQSEAEVKYAFRRDHWGKGLATEALSGLLAHGCQLWEVVRVIATIAPANLASQKVLAKVGFIRSEDRQNEDGSVTQVWQYLG